MAGDQAKLAAISRLVTLSSLTDFSITCGNRTWHVHRLVLAMHSDCLMRVREDGELDLSRVSPEVVGALVEYFYKFDYGREQEAPDYHMELLVVANHYDIIALKDLASGSSSRVSGRSTEILI
ncbi:hypothetical protein AC578_6239 [Pseudocercospora eumusae]|uniref:BTB domain-containing protein n=1 Tax=Pseudocercospora eumusae TaxID=321146 RepID=A0A139H396_9PEZI|nr:hypothetical protein AC578_6239 [Pseudocercospora eumusae]